MGDMRIGEGFVGEGPDAAHVNTVLGSRDGPVGTAWATALATPRAGHVPFVAVMRPGLAVQPLTLFVNKAAIASPRHGDLTWGAAQAGVAAGVGAALAEGVIERGEAGELVLIAAVWVNPEAAGEEAVFANNREATLTALRNGRAGLPAVDDVLAARDDPRNPFFRAS
jgi:5,6,7,8-tetrahydromethanopterin hydro-lyase